MQMWNGKIFWVRQVLTQAQPFGPYFNPTNLAGVMELAVPALTGFAWTRLRRNGRAALYEGAFAATAAGAVFCLAAGVASASKLAVALLVTGLVALGLLGAKTMSMRLAVVGVAVAAVSIGGLLVSGTRLGERVEQFVGRSQDAMLLEGRLVVWQASGEMFRDFPITGSGFGSFAEVFARYLPAGAANRWSHAHNDYVEVLLGGGLVAALLVLWLAVGFGRQVIRSIPSVESISPGRLGLIIGVVSLAVHAFFDFNHQIPANALLWLFCCALLVAVNRRRDRREEES
jgi:O-antigen ligase